METGITSEKFIQEAVTQKSELIGDEGTPVKKKPRTSEDFYLFCKFILDHENYGVKKTQREQYKLLYESSGNAEDELDSEEDSEDDSYDLVTCFCKKPFAGRPMIECSKCLTWIHLSCAKVKKSQIPDVYICPTCKESS